MKEVLKRFALHLPLIGSLVAKRGVLRLRLRAIMRRLTGPCAWGQPGGREREAAQRVRIEPVFVATDRPAFFEAGARVNLPVASAPSFASAGTHPAGASHLRRFCLCCNRATSMRLDTGSWLVHGDGSRERNWRESLVCTDCGMNNRQRLVAKLVQQAAARMVHPRIYLMEQVTPIFEWVRHLPGTEIHGSEYLGYGYAGGQRIKGVRHEDVMNLSYPGDSFDLIVSNDVLEHIPDPARALRECFRVLRRGGSMLATFPFHVTHDATVVRARLAGHAIEHLHPAQYHGNPVSSEGSLVFHDFGWDLLALIRAAGFAPVACEVYSSDEFGHLGPALHVFRMCKPSDSLPGER